MNIHIILKASKLTNYEVQLSYSILQGNSQLKYELTKFTIFSSSFSKDAQRGLLYLVCVCVCVCVCSYHALPIAQN